MIKIYHRNYFVWVPYYNTQFCNGEAVTCRRVFCSVNLEAFLYVNEKRRKSEEKSERERTKYDCIKQNYISPLINTSFARDCTVRIVSPLTNNVSNDPNHLQLIISFSYKHRLAVRCPANGLLLSWSFWLFACH